MKEACNLLYNLTRVQLTHFKENREKLELFFSRLIFPPGEIFSDILLTFKFLNNYRRKILFEKKKHGETNVKI